MAPIVVFLGPTLDQGIAARHLDALYLPPAEQGSVFDAVQTLKPRAIVLIDGVFAKVPAVRHKEILWALHRGIPVLGCASMGALRAAELAAYGMWGYGLVYRWYRATPFADDDEVAVAMTPAELGARPLSQALIDMRLTLRRAERRGAIPGALRRNLEDIARATHFLDRTYPAMFQRAHADLGREWHCALTTLERSLDEHRVDQKAADAIGLLRLVASSDALKPTLSPPWRLTEAWADDLGASGHDIGPLLTRSTTALSHKSFPCQAVP